MMAYKPPSYAWMNAASDSTEGSPVAMKRKKKKNGETRQNAQKKERGGEGGGATRSEMCSEVLDSMMSARGARKRSESPLVYEAADAVTHVFRIERLTVGALRETVLVAAKSGSSCLIVVDVALGAVGRQAIAECAQSGVRIEVFTNAELQFDVMRHVLQPRYELLSAAETAALLAKYKLKIAQLPRLLARDVCARYYALSRGDVVRITRTTSGQDAYSTYRVVVGLGGGGGIKPAARDKKWTERMAHTGPLQGTGYCWRRYVSAMQCTCPARVQDASSELSELTRCFSRPERWCARARTTCSLRMRSVTVSL